MIRNLLKNLLGDSFNESNEKYAKINFGIIILMFVVSAIMLFFLPSEIDILHSGDTKSYSQRFGRLANSDYCITVEFQLH